jgi:hypothetical protein
MIKNSLKRKQYQAKWIANKRITNPEIKDYLRKWKLANRKLRRLKGICRECPNKSGKYSYCLECRLDKQEKRKHAARKRVSRAA